MFAELWPELIDIHEYFSITYVDYASCVYKIPHVEEQYDNDNTSKTENTNDNLIRTPKANIHMHSLES